MLAELEQMDYKNVLYYFSELSAIPRGSGHTKEIADYLENFAKNRKLRYIRDAADNIIVYKAATPGYEEFPALILQGHMDMVCEKESDSSHDFLKDGIRLLTDGEWLFADKTTLGGDDGIGAAYCMALLADDTLRHPALEIVLTTDEETGMDGAKALDASAFSGKYMINLDSEEENVVLCGCAGGMRLTGKLPLKRTLAAGKTAAVTIRGLTGGHSGTEIDKNRTNAVLFLARYLFMLKERIPFLLADFSGGQKDNAIPREADALLLFPEGLSDADIKTAEAAAEELSEEIRAAEPDMEICFSVREGTEEEMPVLHPVSFEKFLFLLMQAPNGVQGKSAEIQGLTESSLNLGICHIKGQEAEIHWSLRSSKRSYLSFLKEKLAYLVDFLGGEWEVSGEYPAWEYKAESKLRKVYSDAYSEIFGKSPEFAAVHAGLECGIFGEKIPGLDMISVGPDMENIHTPAERLNIASALRIYRLLEKILAGGGIS
ncbi:MAG: aminoacyl-histidine dipeptidase [Lachnospiraceae bacterium]|nr:aminoacyl-histidine dipeptidase [Lachnospiraceae bacterium]